jgi:hypothetical protein
MHDRGTLAATRESGRWLLLFCLGVAPAGGAEKGMLPVQAALYRPGDRLVESMDQRAGAGTYCSEAKALLRSLCDIPPRECRTLDVAK